MAQQTEDTGVDMPNPAEIAKTYAEVAQRASRLITHFVEKKAKDGVNAPSDELGVAKAFMDLSARLMANPYKMAQTQMNMMWDYFSLWQNTSMKMMGVPVQAPIATRRRVTTASGTEWEQHFLFDFVSSPIDPARPCMTPSPAPKVWTKRPSRRSTSSPVSTSMPCRRPFRADQSGSLPQTVKSHGQNLIKGLNNLLHDVESGDGQLRIRMTDTSASKWARTLPRRRARWSSRTNCSSSSSTTRVPRNRTRAFPDRAAGGSTSTTSSTARKEFAGQMGTDQGHTTFIISWTNPDEKMAMTSFEDYMLKGRWGD